jgi:hypothetical protein
MEFFILSSGNYELRKISGILLRNTINCKSFAEVLNEQFSQREAAHPETLYFHCPANPIDGFQPVLNNQCASFREPAKA